METLLLFLKMMAGDMIRTLKILIQNINLWFPSHPNEIWFKTFNLFIAFFSRGGIVKWELELTLKVWKLLLGGILAGDHILDNALYSIENGLVMAQGEHRVYLGIQEAMSVNQNKMVIDTHIQIFTQCQVHSSMPHQIGFHCLGLENAGKINVSFHLQSPPIP